MAGDLTEIKISSGQIAAGTVTSTELSATGITAGTYNSLTVDSKGRATAGTNGAPFVTGRYYISTSMIGGLTAMTLTANRLYAVPFDMKGRPTHTFTEIGIRVTTGVDTAKIRFGIYNDNGGVPGSLLLDYGAFTVSGTSAQDAKITTSQALTTGKKYWLALVTDTASVAVLGSNTGLFLNEEGSTAYADTRDLDGGFAAFTYGVLSGADPFPSITATNAVLPVIKLLA